MNATQLEFLVCPKCAALFELQVEANGIESVHCSNGHSYPIVNGIPRFVAPENYAESFGFQWRKFSRIQIDSANGTSFSLKRFRAITEWTPQDLAGKKVLDAGCGAGRFAEVALKQYQADLVACDLSAAVEVCRDNLLPQQPLVCQASIFELPFRPAIFDFVYCIGVLQHTPDPLAAIRSLTQMVKPGGQIGLWIYERDWKSYFGTIGFKYALRPFIMQWPRDQQTAFCERLVEIFGPIAWAMRNLGLFGKVIMRLLPIATAHLQGVPLSRLDFDTWAFLDTFDMYTPAYDFPQRYDRIAKFLEEQGFESIKRHPHGAISVTAVRSS